MDYPTIYPASIPYPPSVPLYELRGNLRRRVGGSGSLGTCDRRAATSASLRCLGRKCEGPSKNTDDRLSSAEGVGFKGLNPFAQGLLGCRARGLGCRRFRHAYRYIHISQIYIYIYMHTHTPFWIHIYIYIFIHICNLDIHIVHIYIYIHTHI